MVSSKKNIEKMLPLTFAIMLEYFCFHSLMALLFYPTEIQLVRAEYNIKNNHEFLFLLHLLLLGVF